ncbi:MAG TPA: hypothetical protein VIM57_04640 [Luteolibacter sp.]
MNDSTKVKLPPCPYLPSIGGVRHTAASLGEFRHGERGEAFFHQALCCAQSRWLEGLPAQALLMLNRAMGAKFPSDSPGGPMPYRAVGWILRHGEAVGFLGNPRRHFQHLATRMSGGETERRIARAWACWELACRVNPAWEADARQIAEEGIVEPAFEEVAADLERHGLLGEADEWRRALEEEV